MDQLGLFLPKKFWTGFLPLSPTTGQEDLRDLHPFLQLLPTHQLPLHTIVSSTRSVLSSPWHSLSFVPGLLLCYAATVDTNHRDLQMFLCRLQEHLSTLP